MKKSLVILIMIIVIMFECIGFAETMVYYPNIDGLGTKGYGYQLMDLVLKKTGKPYKLQLAPEAVNQDRALVELDDGRLSVVDTGFSPDFEKKYDPVYIPIERGLLGWRLFIINKNQEKEFETIKDLKGLRLKKAGQGLGWVDIQILENSGIKVETSPKVENLINMVNAGRFNFFPLGVNEIYGFLNEYGKNTPDLTVEKTIVLIYPFGQFYYVKKGNTVLRDDIYKGLEKMYADGSFQKFVLSHPFISEGLSKANLKSRKIIKIDNPFITNNFKKIDPKWWYQQK